jgi:hypothetical protein
LKEDEILMYRGKICVPNSGELKNIALREIHNVLYVRHSGYHKLIIVVRSQYFWPGMKKEVANYIAKCLDYQKVRTKHKHLAGLLQPFPILEWECEVVTIYFITNVPRTMKQHDYGMVVVDKLTKDEHFILVKTTHKETNIAEIYMKFFYMIHGMPKVIVSDKYPNFTSNFWKVFSKGFGTNSNLSTIYHLE